MVNIIEVNKMAKIYWNQGEINIPSGAFVNKSDGRVFVYTDPTASRRKSARKVIGRAASSTTMYANDSFKALFPLEWDEAFHQDMTPDFVVSCGLYTLLLGIGYASDLYPVLIDAYGVDIANHLMDLAAYSIKNHSDVALRYEETMKKEMCFSKNIYGDSWLSDFFAYTYTEQQNYLFRKAWLQRCKKRGTSSVWLSIDGSNVDCSSQISSLAEKGKSKSGKKNADLVGFLYAVDAKTGTPVTYFVNPGGVVDSKAVSQAIAFLKGQDISVEGVILDRGFCNSNVTDLLEEQGYDYVLMLKSNISGYTDMYAKHAEELRWNVKHLISEDSIFGLCDTCPIFSGKSARHIGLYFDGINGTDRSATLLKKVFKAWKKHLQGAEIPEEIQPYIAHLPTGEVALAFDKLQADVNGKGFYAIASSKDLNAERMHEIYYLRDASEKQFMALKTQLGFDVLRVRSDNSIRNKLAVGFIAGILRNEIQKACKELDIPVNPFLASLDMIQLFYASENTYTVARFPSDKQKKILEFFSLQSLDLMEIANYYTVRLFSPTFSITCPLPEHKKEQEKKRRGRPPKQKKEKEQPAEPKKRGRKPESKNKPKTTEPAQEVKRRRGRPRKYAGEPASERRRPGRPKGSKNRPKNE